MLKDSSYDSFLTFIKYSTRILQMQYFLWSDNEVRSNVSIHGIVVVLIEDYHSDV